MLSRRVNGNSLEIIENSTRVILDIIEETTENTLVFRIKGALRNDLVYEFEDELSAAVSVGKNLELDFSEVNYIASSSLKTLLRIQQKLDSSEYGNEMKISNVPEDIVRVFKEAGLSDLLNFV